MPSHTTLSTSGFSLSQSPPQACDMSQGLWAYYKTVINAFDLSADTVKIAGRKSWCGSSRNCEENV